jgi:hypothetical protein
MQSDRRYTYTISQDIRVIVSNDLGEVVYEGMAPWEREAEAVSYAENLCYHLNEGNIPDPRNRAESEV